MTGSPDGPPQLPPLATADGVAGLYAVFSAMFAIYNRDVVGTGLGQAIDVSLLEPMVMHLGPQPIMYDQLGVVQMRKATVQGRCATCTAAATASGSPCRARRRRFMRVCSS